MRLCVPFNLKGSLKARNKIEKELNQYIKPLVFKNRKELKQFMILLDLIFYLKTGEKPKAHYQ